MPIVQSATRSQASYSDRLVDRRLDVILLTSGSHANRDGRFVCQVQGHNGRFSVYCHAWAVSDGASQWLDGFESVDEAMAAADRYVAGDLDSQA